MRTIKALLRAAVLIAFIAALAVAVQQNSKGTPASSDGSIHAYFCATQSCEQVYLDAIAQANQSIACAQYELSLQRVAAALKNASRTMRVRVVLDKRAVRPENNFSFVRASNNDALMHNKFCVIDGKEVLTGSYNIAHNERDDNNVLVIESAAVARAYASDFEQMWNHEKDAPSARHDFIVNGTPLAVYFCPQDGCADAVGAQLRDANRSIDVMAFSFTSPQIATDAILAHARGVAVQAVLEKRQDSNYSEYPRLRAQGIDARWDGNPATMHHKVFIIDNATVITGSFNPTRSADTRNNENLVIVHSPDVAMQYEQEFARVWNATNG